ncbi:MAG: pyrroloquinoline quinone precursor peptide PqqA [Steroidobacteraceae bacterium]
MASSRRVDMKWQTPLAIDWRFGMEITMYVSNR